MSPGKELASDVSAGKILTFVIRHYGTYEIPSPSKPHEAVVKNDAQLICEALAGDSSSFGELVTRHQDRLYNTMVHVVGSADDARDVVQDAFVQAFVKLDTFKSNSAFYTWLYRIAFNLRISHLRRKKPTVSIDKLQEDTGREPTDADDAPSDRIEQQERAGQVHEALAQLSEEHRSVLVLREMEDRSYEEISAILNVPVGTVRSRLHRARIQLRDQLKEVLQEDLS